MGTIEESAAALDPLQELADGLQGVGHPVRLRALVLLETEQTPNGIAIALGTQLGVTAYHVRMLVQYGLVELVRTEPRRGALQHFYVRTELADRIVTKVGALADVPARKPGEWGTDKRMAALTAWARVARKASR